MLIFFKTKNSLIFYSWKLYFQVKNRTDAPGKAVNGDLHVLMNSQDIIESIQAQNPSNVPIVIDPSPGRTTLHCISNVTSDAYADDHTGNLIEDLINEGEDGDLTHEEHCDRSFRRSG